MIGKDFGQGELRLQFVVALLHLFEAIDHRHSVPFRFWMREVESEKSEESEMSELAQDRYMRRAPLEEGRDGLAEGHCDFYFSAKRAQEMKS